MPPDGWKKAITYEVVLLKSKPKQKQKSESEHSSGYQFIGHIKYTEIWQTMPYGVNQQNRDLGDKIDGSLTSKLQGKRERWEGNLQIMMDLSQLQCMDLI